MKFALSVIVWPGAVNGTAIGGGLPITGPATRSKMYPTSQGHVPEFLTFHVLVNGAFGAITLLSGIVMSATKAESSTHSGVSVGVGVMLGSALAVSVSV